MKAPSELTPTAVRILDTAQQLIQSRGYNGFSYDDISRVLGIAKPSIHHHFRTKAELGALVVRRYTLDFRKKLAHIDSCSSERSARLRAYVELFAETYARDRNLCPGGMLSTETACLPAEVVAEVSCFFDVSLDWLTQLFEEPTPASTSGVAAPSQLALCLFSCLQGSMVVGKALSDPNQSTRAVAEVGGSAFALFERHLPTSAQTTAAVLAGHA